MTFHTNIAYYYQNNLLTELFGNCVSEYVSTKAIDIKCYRTIYSMEQLKFSYSAMLEVQNDSRTSFYVLRILFGYFFKRLAYLLWYWKRRNHNEGYAYVCAPVRAHARTQVIGNAFSRAANEN